MGDVILRDPLGRDIVLHDGAWYGHILKGHPEVREHRRLVERTIERPHEIRQSASDAACRLYFGPGPRPGIMMVVVADVVVGVVKTAHLTRRIKGGALEWPT